MIVLIPAFKEELTISMVVMLSKEYASKVIVVDDGSPDRTSKLAQMAGAEVIRMDKNSGKAAALKVGFKRCREYNPKCVIMIDGDGQMDPALIPVVAAPVLQGEADLVIGSRFIGIKADVPGHRRLGQKILNQATNIGSTSKVTDSQSGYRALSSKALEHMDFDSNSYNIESDMIVHFEQFGLNIMEVPVTVRYDVPNGHKQAPMKHGMSIMSRLIGYVGYKRPLVVFGIPGLISSILGFIICFATFFEVRVIFDWTLVSQGTAGIALLSVGIFLVFASLILNSLGFMMQNLINTIREGREK